jgi:ubiquinone/menaquinone biosynthesis C-methylase UbiE
MVDNYKSQAKFWDKTEPRVMGDFIARPNAVSMLGNVSGKKVLEAGCGTGYVARLIAAKGAEVYGCDREPEMLKIARRIEREKPLGIKYKLSSLKNTGYPDEFFDAISCVAVLMYNNYPQILTVLSEIERITKPSGRLVVSVNHPYMYQPGSPALGPSQNWVKNIPVSGRSNPYDFSTSFYVEYLDTNSNRFETKNLSHPLSRYFNSILWNGFDIMDVQEKVIQKNDLLVPSWGTDYGYPAYLQILATKRKK